MTCNNLTKSNLVTAFCRHFDLLERETEEQIDFYNNKYEEYSNDIYERVTTRLAHWLNHQTHDWFADRIDRYLDYVAAHRHSLLIDIGFSVPYLHSKAALRERSDISALLVDNQKSASDFYDFIAATISSRRAVNDLVVIGDIEAKETQLSLLEAAAKTIADRGVQKIVVAASEVVEHLTDSETFWQFVRLLEERLPIPVVTYVTLPIAGPIPSHHLVFEQESDAQRYLEQRLSVERIEVLKPIGASGRPPVLRGCMCAFGRVVAAGTSA